MNGMLLGAAFVVSVAWFSAGCGEAAYAVSTIDYPGSDAHSSPSFRMRVDEIDRRDAVFGVEASGLPARAEVVLFASSVSPDGSACPESLATSCLALGTPFDVIGTFTADEDGEAWWYVPFSYASNGEVFVQAAIVGEPTRVSEPLRLRRR